MHLGLGELLVLGLMTAGGIAITAAALMAFVMARKRRDHKER